MYTALKSAQNEVNETLLKLVERLTMNQGITHPIPLAKPMAQPLAQPEPLAQPMAQPMAKPEPMQDYSEDFNRLNSTLEYVNQKQNSQFQAIIQELKNVNQSLANLMSVMILQTQNTVNTSTTIPSLQPVAQDSDLKEVHIHQERVGELSQVVEEDLVEQEDQEVEIDEQEEQEEQDAHEDQEDQEVEIDEQEEQDLIEEEEGLEVEEWTFKGRSFFKDSENTVYKNENGEVGDPMGVYDPVKNVIKSLLNK
jgi:hypothetical protein